MELNKFVADSTATSVEVGTKAVESPLYVVTWRCNGVRWECSGTAKTYGETCFDAVKLQRRMTSDVDYVGVCNVADLWRFGLTI